MQRSPLNVLRDHVIAVEGQRATPGLKAVEIMRSLEREGMSIISNEAAALLAFIVARRGIYEGALDQAMIDLGLAKIVPFDPEVHNGGGDNILPGDNYLKYSDALQSILEHGCTHLAVVLRKMQ